ncbi:MAG: hypothetical protein QOJ29_3837 [Thermoleophilaceae bacterium]|nr:hypothetical protein [Thermoleophilaceae bacterium]
MVITLVSVGGGIWLGLRLSRRAGATPSDLPPRKRRIFVLMMVGTFAITLAVVISFASGKPGIGIGILIAFYILPTFITTPLRIRRSRREAEAARAARLARNKSAQ